MRTKMNKILGCNLFPEIIARRPISMRNTNRGFHQIRQIVMAIFIDVYENMDETLGRHNI